MQHRNYKLDFYSPFFSAEKNHDPYRMGEPQKLTSSVDFYQNYHKVEAKSKFMKRELGLPLLFENEELLRPIKAKNLKQRSPEPIDTKIKTGKDSYDEIRPILKKSVINPLESSRAINLPYIATFGKNAEAYKIVDDLVRASYVKKNKQDIAKLQKHKQIRQKYLNKNPRGKTLDNFLMFQKEFYFENPDMKEWAKESKIEEEIEQVKKQRMIKQINRMFYDAGLNEKERNVVFKQLLFEFHPDKNFHEREFSFEIFNYLQENKGRFLEGGGVSK